ncbi:MAG: glycoside hydrolase/phage tail family protein [Pseudomonadota bacterium]
MATLVLAAAGAAVGGAIGGTVLGLSAAAIGKAVGATVGSMIDQTWMAPTQKFETGRVETYRVQSATEGMAVPRNYGRFRVSGQLIWRDTYVEHKNSESHGGKGGGSSVETTEYTYTINAAFALGEGEVLRVGRIWADGEEVPRDEIDIVLHQGTPNQQPDATISAVEGLENTPAFRGTAYIVVRDFNVTNFGNRIPQFNFEVFRQPQPQHQADTAARSLKSVCMIPGSGEFVYGTTPIVYHQDTSTFLKRNKSQETTANSHARFIGTDIELALDQLAAEMPNVNHVSLVVSWFGDDLNCGTCRVAPRVENALNYTRPDLWSVAGKLRQDVQSVSAVQDRPAYGGTPSDQTVIEAIQALKSRGYAVTIYPFVMMDIPPQTVSPDPYGKSFQSAYPWRGEITSSADRTDTARADSIAFFGQASALEFDVSQDTPSFLGTEFTYSAMVLHYALLAEMAGGVDGFLIGSELRGLTRLRDATDGFPGVDALIALLAKCRDVLPQSTEIGYAADWSEYFGFQPHDGSGDVFYNMDALWAQDALDFIGIDAYFPLSDWREGVDHLDAHWGSPTNPEYLIANIAGGEGFDWYYASDTDRDLQIRTPITDGAYGQDWVYRYKDLVNWWSKPHITRSAGEWGLQTAWAPRSKPIVFTEIGCPAVRFGSNQPNVFPDPKTDATQVPYFSDGTYDPWIQEALLTSWQHYWSDPQNNPNSDVYDGQMVRTQAASAWCWDARPFPEFPAFSEVWSDGPNHATGHWLTGRFQGALIADVIAELCEDAGITHFDVSGIAGRVDGAQHDGDAAPRTLIQALMLCFDILAVDHKGVLVFFHAEDAKQYDMSPDWLVVPEKGQTQTRIIGPELERPDAIAVRYYDGADTYEPALEGAGRPGAHLPDVAQVQDLPIVGESSDIASVASRLLYESEAGSQILQFTLPPSDRAIFVGDVIKDPTGCLYRINSLTEGEGRIIEAQAIPPRAQPVVPAKPTPKGPNLLPQPARPEVLVLDLPQLTETADSKAIYLAAQADPWERGLAVYRGDEDQGYELLDIIDQPSLIGTMETPLALAHPDHFSGQSLAVQFNASALASVSDLSLLNGSNAFAIGTSGGDWEVIQAQIVTLQQDGTTTLSNLLRGQLGTEALMPAEWPAGTRVVALDEKLFPVTPPGSDWAQEHTLRVGPTTRAVSDDSYVEFTVVPHGVGVAPYAPAHLTYTRKASGDIDINFIPCVAVTGESWSGEIAAPYSGYQLRILRGQMVLRTVQFGQTSWIYTAVNQATDGLSIGDVFSISALGREYGYGFEARREYNG